MSGVSLGSYYQVAQEQIQANNKDGQLHVKQAETGGAKATPGGNSVRLATAEEKNSADMMGKSLDAFKTTLERNFPGFTASETGKALFEKQNGEGLTAQFVEKATIAAHKEMLNEAKTHFRGRSDTLRSASTVGTDDAKAHFEKNDFSPNGISEQQAIEWLFENENGPAFLKMIEHIEAPSGMTQEEFDGKASHFQFRLSIACELIMSGSELPEPTTLAENKTLIKLTPKEANVGEYSMYFTTEEALALAQKSVADGQHKSLADAFGLPVGSVVGDQYDVHIIEIPKNTKVWTSPVAPTTEVGRTEGDGAKLHTKGGAQQFFVGRDQTTVTSQKFQVSGAEATTAEPVNEESYFSSMAKWIQDTAATLLGGKN